MDVVQMQSVTTGLAFAKMNILEMENFVFRNFFWRLQKHQKRLKQQRRLRRLQQLL